MNETQDFFNKNEKRKKGKSKQKNQGEFAIFLMTLSSFLGF